MRILHTMIRVYDLEKSINFYCNALDMHEIRRIENNEFRYTLVYLGYADEKESAVLELTYNWDNTTPYELGNAYGHIAIDVDNAAVACDKVRQLGGKVTREAGPLKGGDIVIAFVEDPDGYKIEFIETDTFFK